MEQRALDSPGLGVSEIGLACMGMSEFYGTGEESESISTIHQAIELGITLVLDEAPEQSVAWAQPVSSRDGWHLPGTSRGVGRCRQLPALPWCPCRA